MEFTSLTKEFIYTHLEGAPSCHASTLALTKGDLLHAAWFGGSQEGAGDVAVWYASRDSDGWSAPRKLAWVDDTPHWNPVLFSPDGKRLLLFYKRGRPIPRWQTWWMESYNHGQSWTPPRELTPGDYGGRGPVKNKPIVLSDRTWLAPASHEQGTWSAFTDRSIDEGRTWRPSDPIYIHKDQRASRVAYLRDGHPAGEDWDKRGIIQPSLWESSPGNVHMLLRSSEGQVYRSDSSDTGLTWSPAYPTGLPNNNSGIDLVNLESGDLILALNPVGENWGQRTPISLYHSLGIGVEWRQMLDVEDTPGEYSYPSIIAGGCCIYLSYTWNRTRIAVCRIAYR